MKRFTPICLLLSLLLSLGCSGSKESATAEEEPKTSQEEKSSDNEQQGESNYLSKSQKEKIRNADVSEKLEKKLPDSIQRGGKKGKKRAKRIQKDRPPFALHERTPCFGECPIYTLRIWPDGTAKLEAGRYTAVEKGTYRGKVPQEKIERIKAKAKEIGFFELEKVYDEQGITDLPSRITELSFSGKEHRVRNRYEGPEKLKGLEGLFAELVENTHWKKLTSDE